MRIKKKITAFLSIFIISTIICISIGYSAFNADLSISGDAYVRVDKDIRVTNLRMIEATNGAYEIYTNKYTKDTISNFIFLPNLNSTITYEVTVTNKTANEYLLTDILEKINSNDQIGYEIIGTKKYDICEPNQDKKFQIKFFNKGPNINQELSLQLSFEYQKEELPTINFEKELLSSYTKGDSYPLTLTYTTGNSGGNASCNSTGAMVINNITNIDQLTNIGDYTITCTVQTNSGKKAQVSKDISITYQLYTVQNMIPDSSFENNGSGWSRIVGDVVSSDCYSGKCLYINDTSTTTGSLWNRFNYDFQINHKFYLYAMTKGSSGSIYIGLTKDGATKNLMWEIKATTNNWIRNDNIINLVDTSNLYQIGSSLAGTATFYIDDLMLIDLTDTFGAGKEPELDWCKKHISYFDNVTTIYK